MDFKNILQTLGQLSEGAKKSKPDFLDMDKDGDKKEPMKKAAKDAKKLSESSASIGDTVNCPGGVRGKIISDLGNKWLVRDLDAETEDDELEFNKSDCSVASEKKSSLKDWFERTNAKYIAEAEQITIQPAKQNAQVIKKGNQTLGTVTNPALAATIKSAIGKGEMSLAGAQLGETEDDYSAKKARAGKDIGKPGKNFAKIAKSAGKKYGSKEKGEKVAGAVLAKLRGLKEAERPSDDSDMGAGLGAGRSQTTFEGAKPDFLDMDKDGNKKESMKKAVADKKKKKKVDESMNHKISAARLEGKAHGLKGHAYHGKAYEDLEEMKAYHEGYKEGLDECYGQGVYEGEMPATVGGMASQEMQEGEEFGAYYYEELAQAVYDKHPNLDTSGSLVIDLGYKIAREQLGSEKAKHLFSYDEDFPSDYVSAYAYLKQSGGAVDEGLMGTAGGAIAGGMMGGPLGALAGGMLGSTLGNDEQKESRDPFMESLERELNKLLSEGNEKVEEGLSVTISKGQQGAPDSVSVSAQDGEADQLLALIKDAGLGLFGDEKEVSNYGAPSGSSEVNSPGGIEVVGDHDGMMGMMKKLSGIEQSGDADYADEEDVESEEGCGCEGECGCGSSDSEMVDEVESEDQQEFEVAEDNAPDSGEAESTADEDAEAEEDKALAGADSGDEEEINEWAALAGLAGRAAAGAAGSIAGNAIADKMGLGEEDDEEEQIDELSKKTLGRYIDKAVVDVHNDAKWSGESGDLDASNKAFKRTLGIKSAASRLSGQSPAHGSIKNFNREKVEEWANNAGDKGTDEAFERDIEFMTNIISGGLNKRKSTGQTTTPVIASQTERQYSQESSKINESITDWQKLAGIKKL